jgi:hypothetical protein
MMIQVWSTGSSLLHHWLLNNIAYTFLTVLAWQAQGDDLIITTPTADGTVKFA